MTDVSPPEIQALLIGCSSCDVAFGVQCRTVTGQIKPTCAGRIAEFQALPDSDRLERPQGTMCSRW